MSTARAIAVGGVGYGALALALSGFVDVSTAPPIVTVSGGGQSVVFVRPAPPWQRLDVQLLVNRNVFYTHHFIHDDSSAKRLQSRRRREEELLLLAAWEIT